LGEHGRAEPKQRDRSDAEQVPEPGHVLSSLSLLERYGPLYGRPAARVIVRGPRRQDTGRSWQVPLARCTQMPRCHNGRSAYRKEAEGLPGVSGEIGMDSTGQEAGAAAEPSRANMSRARSHSPRATLWPALGIDRVDRDTAYKAALKTTHVLDCLITASSTDAPRLRYRRSTGRAAPDGHFADPGTGGTTIPAVRIEPAPTTGLSPSLPGYFHPPS
jgi:hypothetical protein